MQANPNQHPLCAPCRCTPQPTEKHGHEHSSPRSPGDAALCVHFSLTMPPPQPVEAAVARHVLHVPAPLRQSLEPYLPQHAVPPSPHPHVTLTFATSLDGALSLAPGIQTPLSGPESKAMTHFLRSRHDAILIGVGTAIADNPSLNCRIDGAGGYGGEPLQGQPRPVVIDPRAKWDFGAADSDLSNVAAARLAKVLQLAREGRGRAPWIITALEPKKILATRKSTLEACGGKYLTLSSQSTDTGVSIFSWETIRDALANEGIRSIMIEGGGGVINALLEPVNAALVKSVIVTIAPTWLGQGGVVVCPPRRFDSCGRMIPAARLDSVQWVQCGQDIVLCGMLNQ
ncbi:dihydrofolate reductase-like domain-containing protein [Lineolata rhizophorae]|uniref:2,5-diamino-6-ribosylamino-4(3H)-pyrimidinone 5'-phosphate reductase n=1 Tax=Lineolata rhizophorae TaxID=578093 RepID=A0A6A6NZL5_9PEZI|nr:dihydrofolate reductase-like domain-containing protein [Lineolata rhizophorae]